MATVKTPVKGYNGLSAGVMFKDGKAETDDPRALAYFRRAGYEVSGKADAVYPTAPSTPAAERKFERPVPESVSLGAPLRDAAVEPKPTDFLPPTNAGISDPHGPAVVSPGLHAVPPAPITPGPVAVDDPAEQQKIETAVAEAVLVGDAPAGEATAIAESFRPNRPEPHPERGIPHGPRSAAAPAAAAPAPRRSSRSSSRAKGGSKRATGPKASKPAAAKASAPGPTPSSS